MDCYWKEGESMGNTLIVAEKPAAGADIAKVVGASRRGNGFLEGNGYIVTWAIGHLIGLKKPEEHGEEYGKWQLGKLPLSFPLDSNLKVLPGTVKQFKVIKELIHRPDIDLLINAGDAGREGYLIQEWIYRMAGCALPKKVLWASSLTTAGIQAALDNLKENDLDEFKGILREAEARAEGDYFLGMNYSRLLTLTRAYGRQTLSYGRCQTPLLNLIAIRDAQIENFLPKPYWMIETRYGKGFKGVLQADGKPVHFLDRQEAKKIFAQIEKEKSGIVEKYEKSEKKIKAPHLYNLARLQQDMGRLYNFSPDKTLSIAQSLYETHKILSYPRTDSQFLSMDVFGEIGEHLECCRFGVFKGLMDGIDLTSITADKSYFNDMKVTDHHALIPAINESMDAEYAKLSEEERKVFDAVVLSLIAIFYPEYRYDATTILIRIGDAVFQSSGTTIRDLGFRAVLKGQEKEGNEAGLEILPELAEGDTVAVDSVSMPEKKTVAPKPYNDETIVQLMEKYGIGTSATRADIIKKLQNPDRQFIVREKGKYKATPLGREYIKCIPDKLKDPALTQHFEENLQRVNAGEITKDKFLDDLLREFEEDMEHFTSEKITDAQKIGYYARDSDAPDYLGTCPQCGAAVKSGKFGAYCAGKCGMTFSLQGKKLAPDAVKTLLSGGKLLVKGLVSRTKGTKYDAYFIADGTEPFSFTNKDGKNVSGYRLKYRMEFPQKKRKTGTYSK